MMPKKKTIKALPSCWAASQQLGRMHVDQRASIHARGTWAGPEEPGDQGGLPKVGPAQRGPQGCGELGRQEGQDNPMKGRTSQRSVRRDRWDQLD